LIYKESINEGIKKKKDEKRKIKEKNQIYCVSQSNTYGASTQTLYKADTR